MKSFVHLFIMLSLFSAAYSQTPLWPQGAPEALGTAEQDIPTLEAYWAEEPNGAAVVICPGGGYWMLAMDHEGEQVARWFQERGVHAFVLKYRLGQHGYRHPAMLNDGLRAMRTARSLATKKGFDPDKIGIMGFSAGGHLASTVATQFDEGNPDAEDPIDRFSARPTFCILGYPVISMMAPMVHEGSRANLLGDNKDNFDLQYALSGEMQVKPNSPPTFLVHTTADQAVIPENSVMFYLALRRAGIPAELHIYQEGRHGLGLLPEEDPVFATWADRLEDWLRINSWMR